MQLVDDMHHRYHSQGAMLADEIAAIHNHDSIVVIEKRACTQPMHIHVGHSAPMDGSPSVNAAMFLPRVAAG